MRCQLRSHGAGATAQGWAGLGNPVPTKGRPAPRRDGEPEPWISHIPCPPTRGSACCPSFALLLSLSLEGQTCVPSRGPGALPVTPPDTQLWTDVRGSWVGPTLTFASTRDQQLPEGRSSPHWARLWAAPDVNANLWSPWEQPRVSRKPGVVATAAAAALPYLARVFSGEPRIILPQHRGVADWKIPFSDTKLKDRYFLSVWPTLWVPV